MLGRVSRSSPNQISGQISRSILGQVSRSSTGQASRTFPGQASRVFLDLQNLSWSDLQSIFRLGLQNISWPPEHLSIGIPNSRPSASYNPTLRRLLLTALFVASLLTTLFAASLLTALFAASLLTTLFVASTLGLATSSSWPLLSAIFTASSSSSLDLSHRPPPLTPRLPLSPLSGFDSLRKWRHHSSRQCSSQIILIRTCVSLHPLRDLFQERKEASWLLDPMEGSPGHFDDVERAPILPSKPPKETKEMDENKSKKGLAEIYEEEYVQKTGLAPALLSASDKLKIEATMLFKKICLKLDALSHFHFAPKPVIEDMSIQVNVPALAMEEVAPLAVSDATMLAPEEIFYGKGNIKEEAELTKEERKRRRANQKRRFRRLKARHNSFCSFDFIIDSELSRARFKIGTMQIQVEEHLSFDVAIK
ncbi:hypothetical protein ZIOFF_027699 [Zingiber officinale]|uniref:Uncharacterized protein n=1 Tax=Zingiber officinale TaxID=94328 RepID=A0A8J5L8I9_ZINOF|nr:hypothetical protein ZIOFF_027699 [Zingiber officinale]